MTPDLSYDWEGDRKRKAKIINGMGEKEKSCGSQVKAQPSIGHILYTRSCVRETILPRSWRLYAIVLKVVVK